MDYMEGEQQDKWGEKRYEGGRKEGKGGREEWLPCRLTGGREGQRSGITESREGQGIRKKG